MISEPAEWINPQQVIRSQGFSPLRSLGQNFMLDRGVLRFMVEKAELQPSDLVIEVGPGSGALTQYLLAQNVKVVCVELDRGLAAYLKETYESQGLSVIHGDILDKKWGLHPEALEIARAEVTGNQGSSPKWISNLPYNILTPFLWNLIQQPKLWSLGLFLVQKEFVDRLKALPGDDNYSALSIICHLFLEVEALRNVGKGCFWPSPDVDSAIMRARPRDNLGDLSQGFIDFLKCVFAQRRKVMAKLLKARYTGQDVEGPLKALNLSFDVRAESLQPKQLWDFFRCFQLGILP